ncbi:MAG TPA: glycosyltransferase family 39 protein [Candidatus Binataceae bacterium]|nr:glycosyltransferase family 39 protein [Candidatus Binataceae bacterium]
MRISGWRLVAETVAAFAAALVFLLMMAPSAPFTKELGVCESGAVRDVLAGHIILPRFLPGPIVHVPPLYWWCAALCVHLLGWSEIALRLPALIPTAITAAIVFGWASATISRRAGLWAAAALILCHFTIDAARQPRMDALLATFVTAAIVCLERALFQPDPVAPIDLLSTQELRAIFFVHPGLPLHRHMLTPEENHRGPHAAAIWFTLAALMIGLGILSKGILGIALPGLAIGLYLIASGRTADGFRPGLILSFTGGLMIGLAWYFAGYEIGGSEFLHWQLSMNLWHRFMPVEAGGAGYCAHPFWYFVPVTLAGFIPWSGYLPAAAAVLWRRWNALTAPMLFMLCWFAAIFLFFSSSSGKCLIYILPVFPPLALMLGSTIDSIQRAADTKAVDDLYAPADTPDWLTSAVFMAGTGVIIAGAALITIAGAAVALLGLPHHLPVTLHPTDRRFLEIFGALAARHGISLYLWLLGMIAAVVVAGAGIFHHRPEVQAIGVGLIAAASSLFWFGVMNPALAERETLRGFAQEVAAYVPPGTVAGHIGLGDCDLNFYSPQPLPEVFRFRCDDDSTVPRYIVLREETYTAMMPAQRACLKTLLTSAAVDSQGPRLLVERTN